MLSVLYALYGLSAIAGWFKFETFKGWNLTVASDSECLFRSWFFLFWPNCNHKKAHKKFPNISRGWRVVVATRKEKKKFKTRFIWLATSSRVHQPSSKAYGLLRRRRNATSDGKVSYQANSRQRNRNTLPRIINFRLNELRQAASERKNHISLLGLKIWNFLLWRPPIGQTTEPSRLK